MPEQVSRTDVTKLRARCQHRFSQPNNDIQVGAAWAWQLALVLEAARRVVFVYSPDGGSLMPEIAHLADELTRLEELAP